jgi:hypothetical protein
MIHVFQYNCVSYNMESEQIRKDFLYMYVQEEGLC